MKKDKNSKYWGYMEQNEAVKDTIQPDIGVGKEIILLICEHNVSQSSCFYFCNFARRCVIMEIAKL